MLCYNCRNPGHFKAECPYPIVKKHQDDHDHHKKGSESRSKTRDAQNESSEQPRVHSITKPKSDRRRKALAAEEEFKDKVVEAYTSSSSSDDDS